tara:strand:- start:501 stop:1367 length:867 start_codon:yes stop_codon:yes gene_type:complete
MRNLDLDRLAAQIAKQILSEELGGSETEKEKQDAVAKQIRGDDLDAPEKEDDEKSRLTDEGEEEAEEEDIDPKPKPTEEEETDEGDFEVEASTKMPKSITFDLVKDQINNLRAGKSLKDEAIAQQLEDYFKKLGQAEEQSLFIFLSSLAAILTGGTQGEEAPRPETMGIDVSPKPEKKKEKKSSKPGVDGDGGQAPIIVGEVANNTDTKIRLLESLTQDDPHRCVSGRVVKFGSPACIKDIRSRLEDAAYTRDSCSGGTADRASLNGTLKYLRQKLRAAEKIALLKQK